MIFVANIVVEQEVIAADITIALLILIYTLQMYTNTARSVEAEQRICSNWGTDLLQNVCLYKKWISVFIYFFSDYFTYIVDKRKR